MRFAVFLVVVAVIIIAVLTFGFVRDVMDDDNLVIDVNGGEVLVVGEVTRLSNNARDSIIVRTRDGGEVAVLVMNDTEITDIGDTDVFFASIQAGDTVFVIGEPTEAGSVEADEMVRIWANDGRLISSGANVLLARVLPLLRLSLPVGCSSFVQPLHT